MRIPSALSLPEKKEKEHAALMALQEQTVPRVRLTNPQPYSPSSTFTLNRPQLIKWPVAEIRTLRRIVI